MQAGARKNGVVRFFLAVLHAVSTGDFRRCRAVNATGMLEKRMLLNGCQVNAECWMLSAGVVVGVGGWAMTKHQRAGEDK